MDNNNDLEILKAVEASFDRLVDQASRERVMTWIISKYNLKLEHREPLVPVKAKAQKGTGRGTPKKSKKIKTTLSLVKDLNLRPKGKQSIHDLADEKRPANDSDKCLVIVYYLQKVLELQTIGVEHVYTCFKEMKWKLPANLANKLSWISSQKGWIITEDISDIKTTTRGENEFEHELPRPNENQ